MRNGNGAARVFCGKRLRIFDHGRPLLRISDVPNGAVCGHSDEATLVDSGVEQPHSLYRVGLFFLDPCDACRFLSPVLQGEKTKYFVCCMPGAEEIDLKKAARAVGDKKVEMLPRDPIECPPQTGWFVADTRYNIFVIILIWLALNFLLPFKCLDILRRILK